MGFEKELEGLFGKYDDLLESQKGRLCKFEENAARLKELTLLELAKQIEHDLINAGTVSEDISVYDYLTRYFIK